MLAGGAVMLRKIGDIPGANWFGKSAEGYLCALVFILIIFGLDAGIIGVMWGVAVGLELLALATYVRGALRIIDKTKGKA